MGFSEFPGVPARYRLAAAVALPVFPAVMRTGDTRPGWIARCAWSERYVTATGAVTARHLARWRTAELDTLTELVNT